VSISNVFPFSALKPATFPPTSRYTATPTTTYVAPDGTAVTYLQRRFLPPSSSLALLTRHRVQLGDRLDNVAAEYLGDPLQFWQICDANDAVNPDDLTTTVGALLRITLPAGIPGKSG
jgi:hypothetical protein